MAEEEDASTDLSAGEYAVGRRGAGLACEHSCDGRTVWCDAGRRFEASLSRVVLAELFGSALLVLLTCLPLCAEAAPASPLFRALASGLVVAALVQCFDHVSGAQYNPTVTLAAAIWGRFGRTRAAAMMAAQLAGASLGAGALHLLRPRPLPALCVTQPMAGFGAARAALVEAVLGGVLALANCASWDVRVAHLKDSWPLRIGLTVAGMSLVAGELTGASMNPVRSFGPALCSGHWAHHWVSRLSFRS